MSDMQLTGQAVTHAAFGKGVVTGQENNTITVSFSQGEKRFLYPDAFQKFLTLSDQAAAEQVSDLLHRRSEKKDEKIQALLEEQERQQKIHNFKISVNSQAVFALEMDGQNHPLESWQVSTGTYLSGSAKGEIRIPDKLKPNSLCLLTERPAGCMEDQRRIVGAFMVQEDFFGEESGDGLIVAHPDYRLALAEKDQPLYQEYFPENKTRWGSVSFKYCSNSLMQRILFDLREKLRGTDQEEAAEGLYTYYCKQNRIQGMPPAI